MRVSMMIVFAVALAACGKSKSSNEQKSQQSFMEQARAKELFQQRCVPCHGATGHGDGPASATLNPKPRKFADPAWQASVTDDYLEKIIKNGGAAVGKSPAMPSNPDFNDPNVVIGLRTVVRGFGQP